MNPYVGVGIDNEDYDVNKMFSGTDGIKSPQEATLEEIMKSFEIDKLLSVEKLEEELKTLDPQDTMNDFSQILGTQDDLESQNVFNVMISDVISGLKEDPKACLTGEGFTKLANSVAKHVKGNVSEGSLKKSAMKLKQCMNDAPDKLKTIKDDKGNPVGENMLNSLPQLMKTMGGFLPDFNNGFSS